MENLRKHVLMIGLLDKDTKTQLVETQQAKTLVNQVIGDCTISEATGYFTHEDGEKIVEPSLRVEVLFRQDIEMLDACKTLKQYLNQESIGFNVEECKSMLV